MFKVLYVEKNNYTRFEIRDDHLKKKIQKRCYLNLSTIKMESYEYLFLTFFMVLEDNIVSNCLRQRKWFESGIRVGAANKYHYWNH